MKGRREEALVSLTKLRAGKFSEGEIAAELNDIVLGIDMEDEQGSFSEIFHPKQIRRTIVVVGANFFLQANGQNFTSVYGALFAKSLGTINPFTVTIILAVVNTCTAIGAQVLTDKLGRRCVFVACWACVHLCAWPIYRY
jgi:MFS transporter, SP family, sugar:H+ symporter